MQVAEKNDRLHLPAFSTSALNYLSWKSQTRTFEQLGAIGFQSYTLSGTGDPETYDGGQLSASLLPVLGIGPILGRAFTADDERPGAAHVAVISESLWRRRFAADPGIAGRAATINGTACTIVGVVPRALTLLVNGDIWTPLVIDPPKEIRLNHVLLVVGRLKPLVTMRQAQAEMDAIAARVGAEYPEVRDWGIALITMTDTLVSSQLRTGLLVLLAGVGFLLVIVSANVANLLLARALDRRREMAVRAALGARPGRLLRQVLIESLLLSFIGGATGVLLAVWGVDVLQSSLPANTLPVLGIAIDRSVLLFSVGVTLLTGAVFGAVPAWQASRTNVGAVLKEGGRSGSGSVRPRLRQALAGVELALATVLLVGAALLTRTLIQLQRVPLGFDPRGVLSFQISFPQTKYTAARRGSFLKEFDETISGLPGVERAGLSSGIPFGAGLFSRSPYTAPGSTALPGNAPVPIDWRMVSPGFFDALRIPLLEGRRFTDADSTGAPPVVIISRAGARQFWGDEDPIGRTLRLVSNNMEFTVVGVVGDVRNLTLNTEAPTLYWPTGFRTWPLMDVVVRPSGDATPVLSAIRERLRAMDPDLALSNVRPMTEWIAASAAQQRLNAVMLGVFAAVALAVAGVGIYAVLAYSVSQRTKELGVRMALGADQRSVRRLVVFEGLRVGAAGIAVGIGGAALSGRVLTSIVYGVSPFDPATYVVVAVALTAIAAISCAVPAVRASRVDPITALRLE
jgi:putative ABC transport system permease protein